MISYISEKGKRTYQSTHPDKILEEINKKHRKKLEIVSLELIFNIVRIKNSKNKLICIIFPPF